MISTALLIGVAFAYLLLLFAVASFGDRRARQGRSVIGNAWVYALSITVLPAPGPTSAASAALRPPACGSCPSTWGRCWR